MSASRLKTVKQMVAEARERIQWDADLHSEGTNERVRRGR
jgi:hypothetical protein